LVLHLDRTFPLLLPPRTPLADQRNQRPRLRAGGGLRCRATLPRLPVHLAARVRASSYLAALPGLPSLTYGFRTRDRLAGGFPNYRLPPNQFIFNNIPALEG